GPPSPGSPSPGSPSPGSPSPSPKSMPSSLGNSDRPSQLAKHSTSAPSRAHACHWVGRPATMHHGTMGALLARDRPRRARIHGFAEGCAGSVAASRRLPPRSHELACDSGEMQRLFSFLCFSFACVLGATACADDPAVTCEVVWSANGMEVGSATIVYDGIDDVD